MLHVTSQHVYYLRIFEFYFSKPIHVKTSANPSLKNLRGVRLKMENKLRGGVFSDDTNIKLFKNDSDKQIICWLFNIFRID